MNIYILVVLIWFLYLYILKYRLVSELARPKPLSRISQPSERKDSKNREDLIRERSFP